MPLVNDAALVLPAGVGEVFPHRALKETFAPFTTVHTVVLPGGSVSADAAKVFGSTQRMIWRELSICRRDAVPIRTPIRKTV